MRTSHRLVVSIVALFGLAGASCGSDSKSATTTPATVAPTAAPTTATTAAPTMEPPKTEPPTTAAPTTVPAASGDVVVFAASSLTESFNEMAEAFKADNPDANVTFNFAGSGDLVTQITQGAPADIFVSADDSNMKKLTDAGENVGDPVSIAKNTMEIIVEKGNPKGITGVADLARSDLILVLCADTVPCGKSAAAVLKNAAVTAAPKSFEDKVKGVVTKVRAGEADAGIVYVTDVNAAKESADGVEIPADINVINNYPMVLTKEATNPTAARAFADFVTSAAGQAILAKYGFLPV